MGRLPSIGLVVLGALTSMIGCGGTTAIRNPAPITASAPLDTTHQAILNGLSRRGWTVEESQPGRILALLAIRTFAVHAEIVYDATSVRIQYLSSENLDEHTGQDGQTYAHGNVNRWLANLSLDVTASLAMASAGGVAPATSGAAAPDSPSDPGAASGTAEAIQ